MFSRFTRLPLRRCIHTASASSSRPWSRTAKVVFGASAATATYLTWRLTDERNRLALDTTNPTKMTQSSTESPGSSLPPDSSNVFTSETQSPNRTPVDDAFIPDPEQPDTKDNLPEEDSGETAESSSSAGGGGGAFNPQTGEINWDCPCLGGMAHGPCGPEFKEAFSCFVFSEVEPKGIDCVEKFQAMQTCFRAHPEVYADELMDDDEDEDDNPVSSENPGGLPPVTDSSENISNDTPIPEATSEKKPQLHKAGTRDR